MEKYVVFLRGINVSGKNIIQMMALREALEASGFERVASYIQSGNIYLETRLPDKGLIGEKVSQIIKDHFGLEVPALALSQADLEYIRKNNPYNPGEGDEMKHYHVTLLERIPEQEEISELSRYCNDKEQFTGKENILWLYFPGGYGTAKMNNNFFESRLKTRATTRNWKTILKMSEFFQS